jgi:hypothetical protein
MENLKLNFKIIFLFITINLFYWNDAFAGNGNIDSSGRMNFSVNYRYLPTPSEISFLKNELQVANDFICNMTEGQIRFGDVIAGEKSIKFLASEK